MATKKAIAASLAALSRAFAGEVGPQKLVVFYDALADVTDSELSAATAIVIRTYRGEFIPPPAILRDAVGANEVPAIDVERVVTEIERLGSYNPHSGWNLPTVRRVRAELGEAVANACADIGLHRVCADEERTRAIALQEFRKVLHAEALRAPGTLPAWADLSRRLAVGAPQAKQLPAAEPVESVEEEPRG